MSSTNQSPEFMKAQKGFYLAQTDEEKLLALEEMLKFVPKHKAGESMRANLRERYKKLKEDMAKKKKQKKASNKVGVRKEEMQAVLIGLTGSGKSSLLACLTNAQPVISSFPYTTKILSIGSLNYGDIRIQIVDMPAVNYGAFDQGVANTADTLIVIITKLEDLDIILPFLERAIGEKLIVVNKTDLMSESELRKVEARMKTKKLNFVLVSAKAKENLTELREKLWQSFHKIRVYTKEPGKPLDNHPVVMNTGSSVREIAEKILHGFSKKIKEIRVTGPSSKFPNQEVGLEHKLKDRDIVEFRVKD